MGLGGWRCPSPRGASPLLVLTSHNGFSSTPARNQSKVQGPGNHDVIAFEQNKAAAGKLGGIGHFGFRLVKPSDIDHAVAEVLRAGGRLLRREEFAPGFPFAFVADPDGYEVEIWYE